jgi:hypothetical protein
MLPSKEEVMIHNRLVWAAMSIVMGGLQAWDSGVLQAGPAAGMLVALGMIVPAAALAATANWTAWISSLVLGAVLLAAGRMVSPVSLNAVHIGLMVPAIYVFFVARLEQQLQSQRTS